MLSVVEEDFSKEQLADVNAEVQRRTFKSNHLVVQSNCNITFESQLSKLCIQVQILNLKVQILNLKVQILKICFKFNFISVKLT